jgi:protoporphyrinogen oxidase
MKKIAIIGAGYTGMIAAAALADHGFDVTIFESNNKVGGMTETFDIYDTKLEYFYRHIFKSDSYCIDLIKELGIEDKLIWPKTKMGYYTDGKMYEFGNPISLLKFKPLNFIDKFRLGISILRLKAIKDYKKLEDISAYEWLKKNAGKTAYEKIWEPLLISKFGNEYKNISMAWMWGKIVLRGSSTDVDGERLGYIQGSYQVLTDAVEKMLDRKNVKIIKNTMIIDITKEQNTYTITDNEKKQYREYDIIASTVAYPILVKIASSLLSDKEKEKMNTIQYTAARIMVLFLKKSFMDFYWLNNGNKEIPFGGIIEHTNMINKDVYDGKTVLYISNYMFPEDKLYHVSDEELLREYIFMLKKINDKFDESDIITYKVHKENYAQPLIIKKYSDLIPEISTECAGLYIASMPQIYPEDRGLNYAIRLGKQLANKIIENNK